METRQVYFQRIYLGICLLANVAKVSGNQQPSWTIMDIIKLDADCKQ